MTKRCERRPVSSFRLRPTSKRRAVDVSPPVTVRGCVGSTAAGAHEGRYRPIDIDRTPVAIRKPIAIGRMPGGLFRGKSGGTMSTAARPELPYPALFNTSAPHDRSTVVVVPFRSWREDRVCSVHCLLRSSVHGVNCEVRGSRRSSCPGECPKRKNRAARRLSAARALMG
jgi:hypothetical protein